MLHRNNKLNIYEFLIQNRWYLFAYFIWTNHERTKGWLFYYIKLNMSRLKMGEILLIGKSKVHIILQSLIRVDRGGAELKGYIDPQFV